MDGKPLIRYVAELELGPSYGPTTGVRLVAATLDPATLKPESTWYLATSVSLREASPAQVYALYRLREWSEHFYKPAKHELGWADYQVRPERAVVRHWQLVLLAYTFSLLVGAIPSAPAATATAPAPAPATATDPSPTVEATGQWWGKNRAQALPSRPDPGSGSSGPPRCGACAVGCARGHTCSGTGRAGHAPAHRPSWPRCSLTSRAPCHLRRPLPLPNQPPLVLSPVRN
jgi:Transposase DDE domain